VDDLLLEHALREAYEFAALAHAGQVRKGSQAPYITHPLAVMNVLVDLGVRDATILQTALLHDVVENSHRTMGEIRNRFGAEVAALVAELVRSPNTRIDRTAFSQYLLALGRPARMIMLADRIHNLKGLRAIVDDAAFVTMYIEETRQVFLAAWIDETDATLAEMLRYALKRAERYAVRDGTGPAPNVSGNGAYHDRASASDLRRGARERS
jgi:(p)ppGpp synthase/HD superfamily hydrolase